MALIAAIADAQTKLDASVKTLSDKVDAVLAGQAGSATVAEQQTVADAISAQADAVDAITAKLG